MSDQIQNSDTNDEEEITIGKIVETDTTYKLSVPIEKPEKPKTEEADQN